MRQNNKWMIPAVCSGVALLVSLTAGLLLLMRRRRSEKEPAGQTRENGSEAAGVAGKEEYRDE